MSKTCSIETTPEHEVPFLRTKTATVGIVYVRNPAEHQLLLAKVSVGQQVEFSQKEAFKVSDPYFVLPPKQSVRLKVQVDEAKLDEARSRLMRVQACEIMNVGLYKSTALESLREEWHRRRSHYEGDKACRIVLRCLQATFAPDLGSLPQFFSMNSARSGVEEPGDLSLYPLVDEKAFRSRNGRSPGHSQPKPHAWYNEERETLFESLDRKIPHGLGGSEDRKLLPEALVGDPRQPSHLLGDISSSRSRPERPSVEPPRYLNKGVSGCSTSKAASQSGSLTTNSKQMSRGYSQVSRPIDEAIFTGGNDEFISLENNFLDGRSSLKAREDYHSLVIRARKNTGLASSAFQQVTSAHQPPAGPSLKQPDHLRRLSSYSKASYEQTDFSKNCDPRVYQSDLETRMRNKEGMLVAADDPERPGLRLRRP